MYSNTNPSAKQLLTRNIQVLIRGILLAALILSLAPAPAVRAADQPLTVTITQLRQLGDDFDIASLGDFYARVTINGTTLSSYDQQIEHLYGGYLFPTGNILPNPWVLTQVVPSELGTVAVQIDILDDDIVGDSDRADINPDTNKKVVDIVVDLTTGKWSGDVAWPQSCVSGPIDPSSKSVAICFDISALSSNGDADEDGLLDGWELYGYNADADSAIDIDLPVLGANPLRKDIFVEVDYLAASDHSHGPRQDAIADVVQSFANAPVSNLDGTTGVQLHVDIGPLYGMGAIVPVVGVGGVNGNYGDLGGGGSQIPEAGNEIIEAFHGSEGSATNFATLRADFFDSRRDLIFRYTIFGHQTNPRLATNDCTSGQANRIPGREFLVTLGGVNRNGDPCSGTDINGFSVGNRFEQAGTLMHELGHTLGLRHGGDNEANRKPNYLSVMSYAFQDCWVPASPNGLLPGGCDYSRIDLPTLTETSLDECVGLDSGQLGFGPNNWDGDGLIEGASNCQGNNSNTVADINNDGICVEPGDNGTRDTTLVGDDFRDREKVTDGQNRVCDSAKMGDDVQKTAVGFTPSQPNSLTGFDDWNSLTYSLMAIAGAGSSGSSPVEDEPDPEAIRESRDYLGNLLAPSVLAVKTGPATAIPGDLLTYTVEISNEGRGPALQVVLTDTAPDGSSQVSDIGAVTAGSLATHTSNFTVPLNACPGDFTSVMALVNFEDFVGHQLTASGSAPLEILDVAPPALSFAVSPEILWSPDHKFYDVTAAIDVTDNCDPDPTITLVSVISNEPAAGFLGNGDKGPDILGAAFGTDDRLFSLRSERGTGGQNAGRVYTITYRATDNSGNASEATATVKVPTSSSGSH